MNTITLRLPDALQARLQSAPVANHRSVGKHATVLLELAPQVLISNIADRKTRFNALMAIVQKARAEPILDTRTDNEIVGYNDNGLPV